MKKFNRIKKLSKTILAVITVIGLQATNTYAMKRTHDSKQDIIPSKEEHIETPSKKPAPSDEVPSSPLIHSSDNIPGSNIPTPIKDTMFRTNPLNSSNDSEYDPFSESNSGMESMGNSGTYDSSDSKDCSKSEGSDASKDDSSDESDDNSTSEGFSEIEESNIEEINSNQSSSSGEHSSDSSDSSDSAPSPETGLEAHMGASGHHVKNDSETGNNSLNLSCIFDENLFDSSENPDSATHSGSTLETGNSSTHEFPSNPPYIYPFPLDSSSSSDSAPSPETNSEEITEESVDESGYCPDCDSDSESDSETSDSATFNHAQTPSSSLAASFEDANILTPETPKPLHTSQDDSQNEMTQSSDIPEPSVTPCIYPEDKEGDVSISEFSTPDDSQEKMTEGDDVPKLATTPGINPEGKKDSVPKTPKITSTSHEGNISPMSLSDSHSSEKDSMEDDSSDESLREERSKYYEYDESEEISKQILYQYFFYKVANFSCKVEDFSRKVANFFNKIITEKDFEQYFEMKFDYHYCEKIKCRRLLIKPTRLFFEKKRELFEKKQELLKEKQQLLEENLELLKEYPELLEEHSKLLKEHSKLKELELRLELTPLTLEKEILQQVLSKKKSEIFDKFEIKDSKITNMLNVFDLFDLIVIGSTIETDQHPLLNPYEWRVEISKDLTQNIYVNEKFLHRNYLDNYDGINTIVSYALNFKDYFEVIFDYRYYYDVIECKRLLIRPTDLFPGLEKGNPILKKEDLQQFLNEKKSEIFNILGIKDSRITNMLNLFDLIVIDSRIKTDKRPMMNPHKWRVKISKNLTQDIYIKKEFLRRNYLNTYDNINMVVAYAIY